MHLIFEELFQRAPVGLALIDRELRYLHINDRLSSINGVSIEATLGRSIRDVMPAVADRVEPMIRSVLQSGRALERVEISGETPAEPGRWRKFVTSYLPILLGGSTVVAVAVVVEEITARRDAEAALRASESRHRYLYLRTPAMMHSIDAEGRLVDVSEAWLERMRYVRDEVIGRRSVEFMTPESQDYATQEVLPAYFRTGVVEDIPYQFVRKDGAVLDILLSAVAQRDAEGDFERSLAVLVDITERKRAEEALRRSEAQLRQAQKMEAIGRLAGGIAHDFNNLLLVILGNAELMMPQLDEPSLRTSAEQIVGAAQRAATLTRQILTFSRQQLVEPRVLDLNELIRETESLLCRLLRESIEVVIDLQPAACCVCVDPGQATQILMNLAVNASDAMPNGGRLTIETATVNIEAADHCEPGKYVLLTVTDTGVGMDTETQARLFEPFFTTKEPGRGTGLGLATVHGIVCQNKGWVRVHSTPGRGSNFCVYLPWAEEAELEDDEVEGAPVSAPLLPATILVAEDDAMVRGVVATALREAGYTTLCAGDADEALRMMRAHEGPIDIVLTDVVMPGTSASKLVDGVRQRHPRAQVVYMSGYAPLQPGEVQIEAKDFLRKPFTMDELLRKLAALRSTAT
ncbi:hybrid sensor histidine kinase/response regulator [Enhygromyxa salina]|nr:PAS domain-containing sensor histidine kinase [Enhygromyxa salina]